MGAPNTATPAAFSPGSSIGVYVVEAPASRDSFGATVFARHSGSGDPVTLRVYDTVFDAGAPQPTDAVRERFARAVTGMVRFRHPNIARIFDSGTHHGHPHVALERAEGVTLRKRLTRKKRLAVVDAVHIARHLADALQHAHDNKHVQANLNPDNVLLVNDGRVLLFDTGLADALQAADLKQRMIQLGDARFMAPELASGAQADARADVFSLGALLFYMLTGQPPFPAGDDGCPNAPPNLATLRRSAPVALAEVVRKALARDPKDRYATMYAMQRVLTTALSQAQSARKAWVVGVCLVAAALLAAAVFGAQSGLTHRLATRFPSIFAATITAMPIALAATDTVAVRPTATTTHTTTPTATPTAQPTATPTTTPTATPTAQPTSTPTATPRPTLAPSATPPPPTKPAPTAAPEPATPIPDLPITTDRVLNASLRTVVVSVEAERWGRPEEWTKGDRNICGYIDSAIDSGGERLWRFTVRIALINVGKKAVRVLPERFVLRGRNSRPIPTCASQDTPIDLAPGQQSELIFRTFFEGDQSAPYRIDTVASNQDVCFSPLGRPTNLSMPKLSFGAVACLR